VFFNISRKRFGVIIFDYDIDQAREIIQSCRDIRISPHVLEKWLERGIDFNYIKECLNNKVPLGNNKTMENRFKLIYPHKTKTSEDLYIIIEINDYKNIEVVTLYSFNKNRRERIYEI